jgi:hypothetical protein
MSCRTKLLDNCEGEYAFKRPYHTSHPGGRVMLGDTVELEVALPFKEHNHASCCDSIVDIRRFNKILMGIWIREMIKDNTAPFGFTQISARDAFKVYSPNIKLDFTPPQIGGSFRVRYYLARDLDKFVAIIRIVPLKKGFFYLQLANGVIEDAFCNANILPYWGNFTSLDRVTLFENFANIQLTGEERELSLKIHTAYFFLVE